MKNLVVYVFLGALFTSCAKKNEPVPDVPNCQVVSFNDSLGKPIFYIEYMPNTNKISKIYEKDNNGNIVTTDFPVYYYNVFGQLDSAISSSSKHIFTYYGDGLIKTMRFTYGNSSDHTYSYKYLNGDLIEKIANDNLSSGSADTTTFSGYYKGKPKYRSNNNNVVTEFEYDSDMDLVKTYSYNNNVRTLISECEYDKNVVVGPVFNLYKQLVFEYFSYDDLNLSSLNLTQHLGKKAIFYNSSDGQITKVTNYTDIKANHQGVVTHYKEYESVPQYFLNGIYDFSYACE